MLLIILITVITGCKKEPKTADPAIIELLIGSTSVWSLGSVEFSGKPMPLPTCETNFNYLAFYADGSYTQSIHTCELPFGTLLVVPPTGNGNWQLEADNKTLHVATGLFGTFMIDRISATTLVLSNNGYVSTYTRVPAQPFFTFVQLLTGAGSKTWKYLKRSVGTAPQLLTADQVALRLSFSSNAGLVKSYTDLSYGQPENKAWRFDGERQFGFTSPVAGFTVGNFMYPFLILELSPASFTFAYYDPSLAATVTVYMVPE
jgi:hypothetical protein